MSNPANIIENVPASTEKAPCGICRRQFSKYICPSCNVPYCSLTCFRSESHSQCSEAFYKREIQTDMNAQPNRSAEERIKMMELLKRFEEDSLEDDELLNDENDDEDHVTNLAQRLGNIDLESASSDEIWSMLNPSERELFLQAVKDPTSGVTQDLLYSDEMQKHIVEPWWIAPSIDSNAGSQMHLKRFGERPQIMDIPSSLVKPLKDGPPLMYNISVVCVAYAYITRNLSVSPISRLSPNESDADEARRLMQLLVPFLTDKRANTLFTSLDAAITDFWSRMDTITPQGLSLLLDDASRLLAPIPVTVMVAEGSPPEQASSQKLTCRPNAMTLRVLSDLAAFFHSQPRHTHVEHKLTFYAAHILAIPTAVISSLAKDLGRRAMELSERDRVVASKAQRSESISYDAPSASNVTILPPTPLLDGRSYETGDRRAKISEV
ncbi:hypothetical protein BD410DRAFT_131242 [Rickenella mellea]|uniref:HIT-type domain-containing protein n=1 Tax=Rickenella mellea TaxID=50990 RepID=A0A4Y7Q9F1_9AGAM|nr:hypothetical protein BD410DRAFT_131242 [Rickenella mellea]